MQNPALPVKKSPVAKNSLRENHNDYTKKAKPKKHSYTDLNITGKWGYQSRINNLNERKIKERIHSGLNNKISLNKINNINVPKNCLQ